MSCEIYSSHKVDDTIQSWVATGPKSYAYNLVNNPQIQNAKCKGITLNYTISHSINFDYMMQIVSDSENRNVVCHVEYPNYIKRDRKRAMLLKTNLIKSFSFTFDKRAIIDGLFTTRPYGY